MLRAGIVGYGLAGRVFHGRLLAAAPGIEVAGVVTRDPERRAQAQAEHPGVEVYDGVAEMLGGAQLDVAVVATPNDRHVPVAQACLDAGVLTVVDKPLAPTAAEGAALVEHAEQSGVRLTVFHNRRLDADTLTMRRLLMNGILGDVLRFESRFERWRPEVPADRWREQTAPERGGGVLLDLGSHLVDQAVHLFGPVGRVYGDVTAVLGPADDHVFAVLEHESGVRSQLSATSFAGAPGPRLRVLGTRAALVVPDVDSQEEALLAGKDPAAPREDPATTSWGWLQRGDEVEEVVPETGQWPLFYQAVTDVLTGVPHAQLPVSPWEAVRTLELLERIRADSTRTSGAGEP